MRNLPASFAICLIFSALCFAQSPQPATPPSQQQMMMGYFAGDWTLTGTQKIGPKTPPAPFHATEHGEWVPGQYFMETKTVMHGPLGDVHGVRMMEYNPSNSRYTYNAYNSLGEHIMAEGTLQGGNTWLWNSEQKMNGVITKARYTVVLTSNTTYNFKSEVAKPDGGWETVMEGKATRAQQQSQ